MEDKKSYIYWILFVLIIVVVSVAIYLIFKKKDVPPKTTPVVTNGKHTEEAVVPLVSIEEKPIPKEPEFLPLENCEKLSIKANGTKAFNADAARSEISTTYPSQLTIKKLDVKLEDIKDLNSLVTNLSPVCEFFTLALALILKTPSKNEAVRKTIEQAEKFILKVDELIPSEESDLLNEDHSMIICRLLACYLFIKNTTCNKTAADLVLKIIQTPFETVHITIPVEKAVMFAGPYVLANYLYGLDDPSKRMPEVYNYLKFDTQRSQMKMGKHIDGSYVTAKRIVNFREVLDLENNTFCNYFFKFDIRVPTDEITAYIKFIKNAIYHPKLPLSIPPFTRDHTSLTAKINLSSPLGLFVFPIGNILRYFTVNYSFIVHGIQAGYGFYDSEGDDKNVAHYWTQYRGVFFANHKPECVFPQIGFMLKKGLTQPPALTGSSRGTYFPELGSTFSFRYKNFGLFYQQYCIDKLVNVFHIVTEYIVVNNNDQTISIHQLISNKSYKSEDTIVVYYPKNGIKVRDSQKPENIVSFEVKYSEMGKVQYTYDLKNGNITSSTSIITDAIQKATDEEQILKQEVHDKFLKDHNITVDYFAFNRGILILKENNESKVLSHRTLTKEEDAVKLGDETFEFSQEANHFVIKTTRSLPPPKK